MGIIDIGTLGQQRTGITGINYVKNMLGWDYPCHIIPKLCHADVFIHL